MNVPSIEFGGSGPPLFFLHANGYPPACYQPFLSSLGANYSITAIAQRPLWPDSNPEEIADWFPLTHDLMRFMDERHLKSITCIGHSMGGIALLRAALLAPERFQTIVLIDPVLFPPYIIHTWRLIHGLGLEKRLHPLVAATQNRRRNFDDLERLFKGYRRKPIFKYMNDEALQTYVNGIACSTGNGYELCYSPEWESRIYITSAWHDMDIWREVKTLTPRTLILRGAETDTFWAGTGRLLKRKQPNIQMATVEKSTHLLPLERPREVAELILSFLKE